MSFASDLKVLYHLALKPVRGKDHAARLDSFYSGQAEAYDDFRKRLLKGREELYQSVAAPVGGVWVDMGGGTASNLEFLGERIESLGHVYVVDLASSLGYLRETKKSTTPIRPPGLSMARALSIAAYQSGIIVSE